ncbi:noggin-2-like [Mya arenaria]|uniref:noggin-2-like n=1 Tax=Mya arenaria TaxID=6604 RepID=UPI0022E4B25A|nr:noggin-2-like [Mya arenaria]
MLTSKPGILIALNIIDDVMATGRLFLFVCLSLVHVQGTTRAFLDLLKESDYDVTSDVTVISRLGTSRPAPSDKLPVIDLIENPSAVFDPPESELNHRKLRRLLGEDFDPEFMGIGRPVVAAFQPNGTVDMNRRRGRPKEHRPDFIKDIGTPIRYGSHIRIDGLNMNRRTKRAVKKYIWNYTHCPVVYAWKDLGIRFWPQWIKEGHCYNGRSCSMPPGMMCRPSASETRTLFRWHCPLSKKGQLLKCRWIRIQYPIITKCSCSC